MSSNKICVGSLVSYKSTRELISYDIIYRIHYVYPSNQSKVPVYYYCALKPDKAYIGTCIKFIQ